MDDEDVATLDPVAGVLLPPLEVLGTIKVVVAEAHALEVDHASRPGEKFKREITDELSSGQEVGGRVQVGADVQRHRDFLAPGLVEGKSLDPADRRSRVPGECRRVQREVLGQVDKSTATASLLSPP